MNWADSSAVSWSPQMAVPVAMTRLSLGMSPPGPVPPLAPDELVSTSAERQMLETFLDLYRDILKRKLTGLSDQQIRQRHVPSATTLGGLAKHLAAV